MTMARALRLIPKSRRPGKCAHCRGFPTMRCHCGDADPRATPTGTIPVPRAETAQDRGQPKGYCPSCARALDIADDGPMATLGMCAWCAAGSGSRRAQAGEPA